SPRLAHAMQKARGGKTVQPLAHLELHEPRILDEREHVSPAVDERHQDRLFPRELRAALLEALEIDVEHDVERGNLLLDQAPLVHAPRPLQQERLGVDHHQEVLLLRADVRLEIERSLCPREQEVDGLLDLQPDLLVQVVARDDAEPDEDFAESLVALLFLGLDRLLQLRGRDRAAFQEDVAEPVASIHDRGVTDAARVEIDGAEVVPVRHGQASGLLPHREELEHVGEARLLQAALDGHQRNSSITRAPISGQSHTIFSASMNAGSRPSFACATTGTPPYGVTAPSSRRTSLASSGAPAACAAAPRRFTTPMISRTLCTGCCPGSVSRCAWDC